MNPLGRIGIKKRIKLLFEVTLLLCIAGNRDFIKISQKQQVNSLHIRLEILQKAYFFLTISHLQNAT